MSEHITNIAEARGNMTKSEIGNILEGSLFDTYKELYRDMVINGKDHQSELDGIVDMLEGKYRNHEHDTTLMKIETAVLAEKDSQETATS